MREPTEFWYTFRDLRPGQYTLQLVYQCHDAKLGGMAQVLNDPELPRDTPLWVGKTVSKEMTITIAPADREGSK